MTKLSVRHAPLAQLDRASDYGSEGQEFESLRAYQKNQTERFGSFVFPEDAADHRWSAGEFPDILMGDSVPVIGFRRQEGEPAEFKTGKPVFTD